MIDSKLTQFLIVQAKADKARHSGRTLLDHLVGTHDLLQRWGNSEDICNAGLFHSIYGTVHFHHKAWPLDQRDVIRGLIGDYAEKLACLFCGMNRPAAFFDREDAWLFPQMLRDLREIEAANLIEQGSKGRWLALLRLTDISAAAKAAIDARDSSLVLE